MANLATDLFLASGKAQEKDRALSERREDKAADRAFQERQLNVQLEAQQALQRSRQTFQGAQATQAQEATGTLQESRISAASTAAGVAQQSAQDLQAERLSAASDDLLTRIQSNIDLQAAGDKTAATAAKIKADRRKLEFEFTKELAETKNTLDKAKLILAQINAIRRSAASARAAGDPATANAFDQQVNRLVDQNAATLKEAGFDTGTLIGPAAPGAETAIPADLGAVFKRALVDESGNILTADLSPEDRLALANAPPSLLKEFLNASPEFKTTGPATSVSDLIRSRITVADVFKNSRAAKKTAKEEAFSLDKLREISVAQPIPQPPQQQIGTPAGQTLLPSGFTVPSKQIAPSGPLGPFGPLGF